MKRFRVKSGDKNWSDKGPDLLRTKDNAKQQVRSLIGTNSTGWFTRAENRDGTWIEWQGPMSKADAIADFHRWTPSKDRVKFQLGRKNAQGNIEEKITSRFEEVEYLSLPCAGEGTEIFWSLFKHQFPGIRFAGAYVYKTYNNNPDSDWSDHAWGDAIDGTENPGEGVRNDDTTDWAVRMSSSGNCKMAYILGSKGGEAAVASGPDWDLRVDTDVSDSHEWHVHASIVDHDGLQPRRC